MKVLIAMTAVMSLGLSACGSDSTPAPQFVTGTDVPLTAVATSGGAAVFVKEVVATPTDTAEAAEPLELGDAVIATGDTDEPDSDV